MLPAEDQDPQVKFQLHTSGYSQENTGISATVRLSPLPNTVQAYTERKERLRKTNGKQEGREKEKEGGKGKEGELRKEEKEEEKYQE